LSMLSFLTQSSTWNDIDLIVLVSNVSIADIYFQV
jgi:hypothetical protein